MTTISEESNKAKIIEQSLINRLKYERKQVNISIKLLGENSVGARLAMTNYSEAYNTLKEFRNNNSTLLEL